MKTILKFIGILSLWISFNLQAQEVVDAPYQATATMVNDLIHTKLDVSFNFDTSQLYGEEWVTVSPHFYPTKELVLDAKAMDIHEVKVDSKKVKYTYQEDQLKIELPKIYKDADEYEVYIKYTANPEKVTQEGSQAITGAKGLYFIDPKDEDPEKPTQIWTQGETESSSCWFPTIDKPNQKTSQELSITVPDKYLTLSNGALVSSKKKGDLRTDYWKFDQKHAPYLFFMGIGEFAVVKDKWRDIEVNYYVEKEYEEVAKDIFGHTPEMIEFFSKKMNYDFPWNKYSQMICRDYVSGAMENTTAVIFGDFIQRKKGDLVDFNIAENIVAHELFHHWFGDLVTTESWSNITLNESFANYSEYLWLEYKYGKEKAEAHRFDEKRGYNNPDNFKKDLVRFHYQNKEEVFDGVSYNKGGLILHMLRNYLGDDAFFTALSLYLKRHEYQATEAHQLRLAFEEVSGKDLNWFFNQWYYGNGHPQIKTEYDRSQSGKVTVKITQTQEPLFEFPLAIDVYVDGKPTRYDVWVNKKENNEFTFDIKGKAELININADQTLLCDIEDAKNTEEYLYQYSHAKEYGDRMLAIQYFENAQNSDDKALQGLINAFNDPSPELQIMALQSFNSENPNNLSKATSNLLKLAHQKTIDNRVKANAIKLLAATKDPQYKSLYQSNASVVSNAIKGAAIQGLSFVDSKAAEEAVSKLSEDQINQELALMLVDKYIEKNDVSKMKLFQNEAIYYPLLAQSDPEMGAKLKKAFDWIITSDNAEANASIVSNLKDVLKQYPQAKQVISQIVQDAVKLKQEAISANPANVALKEQLKALQEIL